MKIIIAPDSFKDSLSAAGVAQAIVEGLAQVWPDAQMIQCPMADGGEGTVDAVLAACHGELRRQTVRGPLGAPVDARWGWLADSHTAIIEWPKPAACNCCRRTSATRAEPPPSAPVN